MDFVTYNFVSYNFNFAVHGVRSQTFSVHEVERRVVDGNHFTDDAVNTS